MPSIKQLAGPRIDLKRDDVIRFLVGDQQEGTVRGNRKVPRYPSTSGSVIPIGQPSGVLSYEKADEAVLPAIGPV
jgi:hypothetical protein